MSQRRRRLYDVTISISGEIFAFYGLIRADIEPFARRVKGNEETRSTSRCGLALYAPPRLDIKCGRKSIRPLIYDSRNYALYRSLDRRYYILHFYFYRILCTSPTCLTKIAYKTFFLLWKIKIKSVKFY